MFLRKLCFSLLRSRKAVTLVTAALLLMAGGLLVGPQAIAAVQHSQGSIYGRTTPASNLVVQITNIGTGFTRSAKIGKGGQFLFPIVPPGTYTVVIKQNEQVIATRSGVIVSGGVGSGVNFIQQQITKLSRIVVIGNTINPIDVTSSSSSLVINSKQLNRLPVVRNAYGVALLAPSVVQNPVFGPPSFGGASSAENAYYVNGLNVTDDLEFLTLAQPPFEALSSFQVMTGGIGAAYGNALGGVINMVTKSGSNTFHAGFDSYWEPRPFQFSSPNVYYKTFPTYNTTCTPTCTTTKVPGTNEVYEHNADNRSMNLRYNIWGSGPIIKNHLFFYGLVQQTKNTSDTYGLNLSDATRQSTPYGLARLDAVFNSSNILTLTYWKTTGTRSGTEYNLISQPGELTSTTRGSINGGFRTKNGSKALIGHYTLYLGSHFNISALYGYLRFDRGSNTSNPDCPIVFDARTGVFVHKGCWVNALQIVSPGATDARHEYRIDAEWTSGDSAGLLSGHDVTFGYDRQYFRSDGIRHYPGPTVNGVPGFSWIYYHVPASGVVNSVCYPSGGSASGGCPTPAAGASYVTGRQFLDSGSYYTRNSAYYIQDDWHIMPNLYLRLGIRNASFKNFNKLNQAFISQANEWAPRLGFSWNVYGDSTLKVFGSYSRYYIPVANNTNIRSAGGELDLYHQDYTFSSINPVTGAPTTVTKLGPTSVQGTGIPPNPLEVAARNLKPMSEKEIILGFQKQLANNWSYGVKFMHRWLVNGSDDICSFLSIPPFKPDIADYAASQGWNVANFLATLAPTSCIVSNPGANVETYAAIGNDPTKLSAITIPNSYLKMPRAERYYNAVELTLTKAFSNRWFFGASYTWSHSYGNEEGYVLSQIAQTDAGITEAFDFTALEQGAYGDLANDHRHVFKFWGTYQFLPDWRVGGNLLVQSGKPLSCLGTYPEFFNIAYFYGSFSHWCGSNQAGAPNTFPYGGTLHQQGTFGRTPWIYNLNLQLAWTPVKFPGLTVMFNWFNVLGTQHAIQQNQAYDNGNWVPQPTFMLPMVYQQPTYFQLALRYRFL